MQSAGAKPKAETESRRSALLIVWIINVIGHTWAAKHTSVGHMFQSLCSLEKWVGSNKRCYLLWSLTDLDVITWKWMLTYGSLVSFLSSDIRNKETGLAPIVLEGTLYLICSSLFLCWANNRMDDLFNLNRFHFLSQCHNHCSCSIYCILHTACQVEQVYHNIVYLHKHLPGTLSTSQQVLHELRCTSCIIDGFTELNPLWDTEYFTYFVIMLAMEPICCMCVRINKLPSFFSYNES